MLHRWRFQFVRFALTVAVLASPWTSQAGPFDDCLDDAGLALVTAPSNLLQVGSDWTWLFGAPGTYVSCDPPSAGYQELTAGGRKASAGYAASVGVQLSTAALSSPGDSGASHARLEVDQYFAFEVVPDDPTSTAPVTIDIVTRHRFGSVTTDSSSPGSAGSGLSVYHELRRRADQVYVGPTWSLQVPVADGGVTDLFHRVEVPVNTPLRLLANLDQRSDANSGGGSGSGAAGANTTWTLEVTTDAAATVVFDSESLLGVAPPRLDDVPEPELGTAFVPLTALLGWAAAARRQREAGASR